MNGYEALYSSTAYIDLSERGKIDVKGEDRARLIHAMSTNDIASLAEGQGVYAFFLSAQGRILADAYIYNLGDRLLLDTEPELAAKLTGHLDKYIIADDVELTNETTAWSVVGIEGPSAYERASMLGLPVPEKPYSIQKWVDGFVVRVASTGPNGLRIFAPPDTVTEFVRRLEEAGVPKASAAEARTVRIENGIPRYGEDISERYLVQETGQMQAVHSNKGCYLGQEIVERVRSRAQIHRHLRPIHLAGTEAPPAGTKLSFNGSPAAEITSAVYSPRLNQIAGLAYVRTEIQENQPEFYIEAGSNELTPAVLK